MISLALLVALPLLLFFVLGFVIPSSRRPSEEGPYLRSAMDRHHDTVALALLQKHFGDAERLLVSEEALESLREAVKGHPRASTYLEREIERRGVLVSEEELKEMRG